MRRKRILLLVIVILMLVSVFSCAAPEKSDIPLVLLTDYGTDDYRVPRLKGVIYNTFIEAIVIDATHGIASYDIAAGAYVLGLTAKEFPKDVVFIAAVGARSTAEEKSLVLTTNKNQICVAPDNGLLTYVIRDEGVKTVYEVTNQDLFDQPISTLSSHYLLGKIGALVASGYQPEDKVRIIITGNLLEAKIGNTYNDVDIGELVIIVNSLGTLQLSKNKGSFAGTYGIKTGIKFEIEK